MQHGTFKKKYKIITDLNYRNNKIFSIQIIQNIAHNIKYMVEEFNLIIGKKGERTSF